MPSSKTTPGPDKDLPHTLEVLNRSVKELTRLGSAMPPPLTPGAPPLQLISKECSFERRLLEGVRPDRDGVPRLGKERPMFSDGQSDDEESLAKGRRKQEVEAEELQG